jgi:hypothetical protein
MSKNNLNILTYAIYVKIRGRKAPEVRDLTCEKFTLQSREAFATG